MNTYVLFIHVIVISILVTNLDNMVLFLTFSSLSIFRRIVLVLGYLVAMALILAAIYLLGLITSKLIPLQYITYLGIIPIIIGVIKLFRLWQSTPKTSAVTNKNPANNGSLFFGHLLVSTSTQLACSVDCLAVFVPLLVKHPGHLAEIIFGITFIIVIAIITVGLTVASYFVHINWLEKYGKYLVPPVLILIGIYILFF
jgi:cadmium resistance protein CadD (predicted permease)